MTKRPTTPSPLIAELASLLDVLSERGMGIAEITVAHRAGDSTMQYAVVTDPPEAAEEMPERLN